MNNSVTTAGQSNYVAKTFSGLEQVLAGELRAFGAADVEILRRGVLFRGDQRLLYRANILCRTALSILKPLGDFRFDSKDSFYDQMRTIKWTELFPKDKTISVIATAHDSEIFNNTMFVAQLSKDAIVDQFNEAFGSRPSVDTALAQVRIVVNIQGDNCKVSLDSSGEALFKRGYRKMGGMAPINEALAAGLIMLSGWDKTSPFLDPMCGSGTFSIEAAMMAAEIAPGLDRKVFGFSHWNDFANGMLEEEKEAARSQQKPLKAKIIASDLVGKMLDITRTNIMGAGLMGQIKVQKNDFFSYHPREENGWVLLNPPYGQRMKEQDIRALYIHIGDTLKNRFTGYRAGIISAELDAMKHLGLRPKNRFQVFNGPLKATFNIYELFEGGRDDYVRSKGRNVESQKPKAKSQQPKANSQKPTANSQKPTAKSQQPKVKNNRTI